MLLCDAVMIFLGISAINPGKALDLFLLESHCYIPEFSLTCEDEVQALLPKRGNYAH